MTNATPKQVRHEQRGSFLYPHPDLLEAYAVYRRHQSIELIHAVDTLGTFAPDHIRKAYELIAEWETDLEMAHHDMIEEREAND